MANTLNLGNGDWATKENSLLGYNSENGNYKPLPFDFTRASNGTFINKSRLIETAANGVPRIDFSDSTSGALKLEPQRTNLLPYSEALSNSSPKSGTFVDNYATSPDGTQNATKLTATNADPYLYQSTTVSAGDYTISIYVKGIGSTIGKQFILVLGGGVSSTLQTITSEWKRFTFSGTLSAGTAIRGVEIPNPAVTGDEVLVWGMQLEQGSYATSLINTQGSAVTRVADVCSQTVPSGIINSSEGVLYAEFEISDLSTSLAYPISIYGTGAIIQIYYRPLSQSITFLSSVGGIQYLYHSNINPLGVHKVALAYKNNEYSAFADGVLLDRQNSGNVPSPNTLNVLGLKDNGSSNFSGKVKDVRVYNTALTDAELIALTS